MAVNGIGHPAKSLLVVDDDPHTRELCAGLFESLRIFQVTDARQAQALLPNETIDLVLSDVTLPEIDGLELLQFIKQQQPDLPVILMTGHSDKDIILKALKGGAEDVIAKPIDGLQLRTTVEKVFERQALRQELADLQQIDRLKHDFLGLISHKLKTPTTTISLFIQNLAEGIENPNDVNFLEILTMVQKETLYLEKLIQDLLYFSEATLQQDAGVLELTDLGQVARQVVEELRATARDKSQQLNFDMQVPLTATPLLLHPQKIHFAIRALLDNAIKFTPEHGTISLSGDQLENRVRLSISDNGNGITPTEMTKIFSKFYQVDPQHTGQVPGFGLGLYYAREFIRAMGGKLQLNSRPGAGTTAIIEFHLPG